MFPKTSRSDGKTFNVSKRTINYKHKHYLTFSFKQIQYLYQIASNQDKLKQLDSRLQQAIALYKRRLDWLTSESRRIFGVIEEKSIGIVLDIINMSPQLFRQYRTAMERVVKEQVAQLAKFNLIR